MAGPLSIPIQSIKLNTGALMPIFGLGTWLSPLGKVGPAVKEALKLGYRHIDCAHIYDNEKEIGEVLEECFKEETGVCKREEVFITSKLWNTDQYPEHVVNACKLTLKNLKLDYLDLYLIHWSHAIVRTEFAGGQLTDERIVRWSEERMAAVWSAMEELVKLGLTKAIGISNFTIRKTEALLKTAKIIPAVNQVESQPFFQQPNLKKFCDLKGIIFEAYSPLGAPERPSKEADDPVVLEDTTLITLAEKYNATPAQICIAFQIARGVVVIPKTVTLPRVKENLLSTQIKLSDADFKSLVELDKNKRIMTASFLRPNESFESFWDTEYDGNYYK